MIEHTSRFFLGARVAYSSLEFSFFQSLPKSQVRTAERGRADGVVPEAFRQKQAGRVSRVGISAQFKIVLPDFCLVADPRSKAAQLLSAKLVKLATAKFLTLRQKRLWPRGSWTSTKRWLRHWRRSHPARGDATSQTLHFVWS